MGHTKRVAVLALLLAAALGFSPDASAKIDFERCGDLGFECARVNVPLDRAGAVKGRVSLYVRRLHAQRKPARGATFLLAGGPGQSATDAFSGDGIGLFGPAFRTNQLIVYDQRGTGRSDVLRCPTVERTNSDAPGPVAACARRLGARRAFYTTNDSVEDIEAIRRRLGVAKVTLAGTSYGTKVALGYALRYPANVERLVLDSVVEATGPNAFDLDSFAAVPRVLTSLCAPACASFTQDPVGDVARLVAAMTTGPLRGRFVNPRGRAVRFGVTRADLFGLLLTGDLDPMLRAATPGAVSAALAGDLWPLTRLVYRSKASGALPPPKVISAGLFVATSCEETVFPWPRATPPAPAERDRLAVAGLAAVPDAAFAPFDRFTAQRSELISLCGAWPESSRDPVLGPGPLPDVPVLLLAGGQDLRTPLESAQHVAGLFPQAQLVTVPRAGHSVLGADMTPCSRRAMAAFFASRPVNGACPAGRELIKPAGPPPTALSQVPVYRGMSGKAGRTVEALRLTLNDMISSIVASLFTRGVPNSVSAGGLRGGTFRIGDNGITMKRLTFVPGIRVSGSLPDGRQPGRLQITGPGAPNGRLTLRGKRLTGRLGGKRVNVRFDPDASSPSAARAAAAALPRPPVEGVYGH